MSAVNSTSFRDLEAAGGTSTFIAFTAIDEASIPACVPEGGGPDHSGDGAISVWALELTTNFVVLD